MNRRKVAFVATGLIVAVAAIVITFVVLRDNGASQGENQDSSAVEAEEFTAENVEYLEEKLNSSSQEEQALALVPAIRAGKWDGDALFRKGAVLEIERSTFEGNDKDGYTVLSNTVLDDTPIDTYALNVVYIEPKEKWLVAGTTKIEGE